MIKHYKSIINKAFSEAPDIQQMLLINNLKKTFRARTGPTLFFTLLICSFKYPCFSYSTSMDSSDKATLGMGCFWCTEAIFQRVKGVDKVVSGQAGGHVKDPTQKQICSGNTGHAEVLQITFNPGVVSQADILRIFFHIHDPTTLNRQGNDVGTQYRSIIMYHDEKQKETALQVKKEIEDQKVYKNPIVTEIVPLDKFYPAEDYHQNYYNDNKNSNPYCGLITHKIEKFNKLFAGKAANL